MAAPKRDKGQREKDLVFIENLYVKAYSLRAISAEIGKAREYTLNHQTIDRDVKTILKRWREDCVHGVDELKRAELAKIAKMEREAWEAWERSKLDRERALQEKKEGGPGGGGSRAQIVKEGQCGDPKYLQVIQWCIKQRCDILGLNAPIKQEHSGPNAGPIRTSTTMLNMGDMSVEKLREYLKLVESYGAKPDTQG